MPADVLDGITSAHDPAYAWSDGRQLGRQILKGDDLRCLPESVDPAFRDPRNFDQEGRLRRSLTTCSSFAINDYHAPFYGGTLEGQEEAKDGDCKRAEDAFRNNPSLHSMESQGSPDGEVVCPTGHYMIVPYARRGSSPHVLRQLSSGQFAHVTSVGGQVQLFYSRKTDNERFVPITRYTDLPDSGELARCRAICIQPRTRDGQWVTQSVPQTSRRGLTGNWAAVTPKSDAKPVPYAMGFRCGPHLVRVFLKVGLPLGYSFPNGVTLGGPNDMALDVMSTVVESSAEQIETFGYTGAYTFHWARRNMADPNTLDFRDFYYGNSSLRRVRRTGQLLPRLVDSSKGVVLKVFDVREQTFKASVQWDSPCQSELVFHRTPFFRGPAQVVSW